MITADKELLEREANTMQTIDKHGRTYIVKPNTDKNRINIGLSHFLKSGMALCGVLGEMETLKDFKKKWVKQKLNQSLMN